MKKRILGCCPSLFAMILLAAVLPLRADTIDPAYNMGTCVQILEFGGMERGFLLHLPPQYDGVKPMPVVFVFHAAGGKSTSAEQTTKMSEKADKEGFIVVYPEGTGPTKAQSSNPKKGSQLTWNAGGCCGFAKENNVDDVGFVRAIVQKLRTDLKVDPARIYAAGFTNGGMFCYRLACEASDIFAAVAPVAASMYDFNCSPSAPVSVIAFNGTRDKAVPYNGGTGEDELLPGEKKPVPDVICFWARENGCKKESVSTVELHCLVERHTGGKNGTDVVLYVLQGAGAVWPLAYRSFRGDVMPTTLVDANDAMWDFFKAHPKK